MGPKKKVGSGKVESRGRRVKNKHGINHQNISPSPSRQGSSAIYESVHNSNGASNQQASQLSQMLLGRKNKLNDFLTSNNTRSVSSIDIGYSKISKAANKEVANSFEEDDDFIYKRSQSVERIGGTDNKRKHVSTPVSQLQTEIRNMSKDDDDLFLEDLGSNSRQGARKDFQTRRPFPKSLPSRQKDPLKDSTRNFRDVDQNKEFDFSFEDDMNSDDYVEQVSRHTVSLSEPLSTNEAPIKSGIGSNLNKRRSSYYNRGKRVSSIGNGFQGEIHEDVPVTDYYKRLDTSLPEPDKMRQLLIWCFKRKLREEETNLKLTDGNSEERMLFDIAKVIKEEIIHALMKKQISTSWYANSKIEDDEEILTSKEVTVPNPQNKINLDNIEIYKKRLKDLLKEREELRNAYKDSISRIESLSVEIDSNDTKKLHQYISGLRNGISDIDTQILNEKLISTISENYDISADASSRLGASVDLLHSVSHKLGKISDLSTTIQSKALNSKVSNLLKAYVAKNSIDNYQKLIENNDRPSWPYPTKSPNTIELLKGVTRLESRKS